MGDDDNAAAALLHSAEDIEQRAYLLRGEHCGRLVQDKNVRAAVEYLHDLHRLFLTDGHVVDLLVRVDGNSVLLAEFVNAGVHLLFAEHHAVFLADDYILGGGQHVYQLEVLVYHADAGVDGVLRGAEHYVFPAYLDLAAVRGVDTAEHVYQRALTGAVLTEQREYLALADVDGNVLVRLHRAEALADVF